jgi:hypothetical protein
VTAFFSTPRGQAYGFGGLGIAGVLAGVLGIWMLMGGDGGGDVTPAGAGDQATATTTAAGSATATRTVVDTAPPTPTPRPRRVLAPRATPSPTVSSLGLSGGGGGGPAATSTPPPIVAAGDYCDTVSGLNPPATLFGLLTIAGAPAPAGTTVTVLFDGGAGPSVAIAEAGGYSVRFAAGAATCANNRSAAISVAVNGAVFSTGYTVASGDTGGIRFDIAVP